jgi:hypothetical protein
MLGHDLGHHAVGVRTHHEDVVLGELLFQPRHEFWAFLAVVSRPAFSPGKAIGAAEEVDGQRPESRTSRRL